MINYPFKWRRYPLSLFIRYQAPTGKSASKSAYPDITHADLVVALSELEGFVDISEHDLLRIYELATKRPHPALKGEDLSRK